MMQSFLNHMVCVPQVIFQALPQLQRISAQ